MQQYILIKEEKIFNINMSRIVFFSNVKQNDFSPLFVDKRKTKEREKIGIICVNIVHARICIFLYAK